MQVDRVTTNRGFQTPEHNRLLDKARELEAAFLSQMLAHSGLGTPSAGFGGGVGEDQFASFLRDEQARLMVAKGGIGLAEMIFRSLAAAQEVSHDQ
ncbi:MAG: rod-binding protein [Rhodobacteraceae bacterium]|nr:rod-binding protein [Paracoccaceae bacterium]